MLPNLNIIARKPKDDTYEYAVMDRGPGHFQQFVSATISAQSIKYGEWFWGNYFETKDQALAHFNSR